MFKSSQEIRLNTSNASPSTNHNDSENICVFGKYLKTPDAGEFIYFLVYQSNRIFVKKKKLNHFQINILLSHRKFLYLPN